MSDLHRRSRSIVINTKGVLDLVWSGRDLTGGERADVVDLIDLLMRGLGLAIEKGLPSDMVQVWAHPDLGEGALYKCRARKYSRMVEMEFDVFNRKTAMFEGDIESLQKRFVPGVLSVPIHNAAYEPKILIENDPPMIFAYGLLYKGLGDASMPVSWDLRHRDGRMYTYEDVLHPDSNPMEVMACFQDHSLEPQSWILSVPVTPEMTAALVAAAHIDGRENVSVSFAFPEIWLRVPLNSYGEDMKDVVDPESYDLLWDEETVLGIVRDIGNVEGNVNMVLGLEVFGRPLSMFKQGMIDEQLALVMISGRMRLVAAAFGLRW